MGDTGTGIIIDLDFPQQAMDMDPTAKAGKASFDTLIEVDGAKSEFNGGSAHAVPCAPGAHHVRVWLLPQRAFGTPLMAKERGSQEIDCLVREGETLRLRYEGNPGGETLLRVTEEPVPSFEPRATAPAAGQAASTPGPSGDTPNPAAASPTAMTYWPAGSLHKLGLAFFVAICLGMPVLTVWLGASWAWDTRYPFWAPLIALPFGVAGGWYARCFARVAIDQAARSLNVVLVRWPLPSKRLVFPLDIVRDVVLETRERHNKGNVYHDYAVALVVASRGLPFPLPIVSAGRETAERAAMKLESYCGVSAGPPRGCVRADCPRSPSPPGEN